MSRRLNLAGRRFGRLTAVEVIGSTPQGRALWLCECDCGEVVIVRSSDIARGAQQSCGCYRRDASRANGTRHGHAPRTGLSRTYRSWSGLIQRATNPNNPEYPNYGGRGITVCDRWRDSFAAFLADMGESPPGLTIDRIDVDGHYEPGNCRWATWSEQRRNQRRMKGRV